jgi:hypothetical protein
MTLPAHLAFFTVGGALVLIGLLVTLGAPAAGLLILVIGSIHLLVGVALRSRQRKRAAPQTRPG